MKRIIFKVQVSLFSSDDRKTVMIYNKDRSIEGQFPLGKELKQYAKDRAKFFVYGEMIGTETNILGEAPWQEW